MRPEPRRVRYFDGQVADAALFHDGQDYLIDRLGRHESRQHATGVVEGLTVALDPSGPRVLPGRAISESGKHLVLDRDEALDLTSAVDVGRCDIVLRPGEDRLERRGPVRAWHSTCRVLAVPADQTAAVEPDDVLLGRLARDDRGDWTMVAPPQATAIGLLGRAIRHPTGSASISLHAEDPSRAPAVRLDIAGDDDAALLVGDDGGLHVNGDLIIERGPLVLHEGLAFRGPSPALAAPASDTWRLGVAATTGPDGAPVGPGKLRIDLPDPADDALDPTPALIIGREDESDGFQAILAIAADGTVTVHGDLQVAGAISEGPLPADPREPRFAEAIKAAWTEAYAAAQPGLTDAVTVTVERVELVAKTKRLRLAGKIENPGARPVKQLLVRRTLIAPGMIREQQIWPRGAHTATLRSKTVQNLAEEIDIADVWEAGGQVQVILRAHYESDTGQAEQAFAMEVVGIPDITGAPQTAGDDRAAAGDTK